MRFYNLKKLIKLRNPSDFNCVKAIFNAAKRIAYTDLTYRVAPDVKFRGKNRA